MRRATGAVLAGLVAGAIAGCATRAQPLPRSAADPAPRPQPRVPRPAQAPLPAAHDVQPAAVPVPRAPTGTAPPATAATPPVAQPGADTAAPRRQGERLIRELEDSTRPPPPAAPASLPDRPGMGRPFGR